MASEIRQYYENLRVKLTSVEARQTTFLHKKPFFLWFSKVKVLVPFWIVFGILF